MHAWLEAAASGRVLCKHDDAVQVRGSCLGFAGAPLRKSRQQYSRRTLYLVWLKGLFSLPWFAFIGPFSCSPRFSSIGTITAVKRTQTPSGLEKEGGPNERLFVPKETSSRGSTLYPSIYYDRKSHLRQHERRILEGIAPARRRIWMGLKGRRKPVQKSSRILRKMAAPSHRRTS